MNRRGTYRELYDRVFHRRSRERARYVLAQLPHAMLHRRRLSHLTMLFRHNFVQEWDFRDVHEIATRLLFAWAVMAVRERHACRLIQRAYLDRMYRPDSPFVQRMGRDAADMLRTEDGAP